MLFVLFEFLSLTLSHTCVRVYCDNYAALMNKIFVFVFLSFEELIIIFLIQQNKQPKQHCLCHFIVLIIIVPFTLSQFITIFFYINKILCLQKIFLKALKLPKKRETSMSPKSLDAK
jgi:hypothetical protein